MMDDNTKIQALMVYFHHWGMYETKAEQDRKAFIKTMDKIRKVFCKENRNIDFLQEVQFKTYWVKEIQQMGSWVQGVPVASIYLLNEIADTLLSNMGGCHEMFPVLKKSHYFKIAKILKMNVFSIACMDLSKEDILSVNAIVALR